MIRDLYKLSRKGVVRKDIVESGYHIYVEQTKEACTVNRFLQLCHDFKYPHKALSILGDIETLLTSNNASNHLSYPLLIDVYGQCSMDVTQELFDYIYHTKKKQTDIRIISAMMNVYLRNHCNHKALALYQNTGSINNDLTHNLAIKACTKLLDRDKGQQIHKTLKNTTNIKILNSLIHLYDACNDMDAALSVFNSIKHKDIVVYNTMMLAFINSNNDSHRALQLYDTIDDMKKDNQSHIVALKGCINTKDLKRGQEIHHSVLRLNDVELHTAFIEFYGAFNDIWSATDIFNSITQSKRTIECNNAMLTAYIGCGYDQDAITLYDTIRYTKRNEVTHCLALSACIHTNNYKKGKRIHGNIPSDKLRDHDALNALLIEFYASSGEIQAAKHIFESIKHPNKESRRAMMKAYCKYKCYDAALNVYNQIKTLLTNDDILHTFALQCCIETREYDKGVNLCHLNQSKHELIRFYGAFGDMDNALNVFNSIESKEQNSFCVAQMMKACIDNEDETHALQVFDDTDSALRNERVYILAFKACGNSGDVDQGKMIHSQLPTAYLNNIAVNTSLVDMYGACMDIAAAWKVFNGIDDLHKTIACVNCMMNVYYKNGMMHQCMALFRKHLQHDVIFYTIVLACCTDHQHYLYGEEVHDTLRDDVEKQWLLHHVDIRTSLIHLYAKCGRMDGCEEVFHYRKQNEITVWNAMIQAHGTHGNISEVRRLFEEMTIEADNKTFVHLINAYSHCGDVDEAIRIWEIHSLDIKHDEFVMSALIDGMARGGYVDKAFKYLMQYNVTNQVAWIALISGCKTHNEMDVAQRVMEEMLRRFDANADCICAAIKLFGELKS
eukprot:156492_1